MAEKMSTLVLKVDLDCYKCYNKIRKTLCKLHYEIRSQAWDKKQNTVTISGPFDPEVMSKKLESKAGKVIKSINQPKAKASSDAKPDKPAEKKPAAANKPAEKAAPEMKMVEPQTVIAYPVAQPPYGTYYEGYDQGPPYYHLHGYNARPVYNYGENNRGYVHGADYFSEENPTCSIM